jgi:hypothetical protein
VYQYLLSSLHYSPLITQLSPAEVTEWYFNKVLELRTYQQKIIQITKARRRAADAVNS